MYAITTNKPLLQYNTFGLDISSNYFTNIDKINDLQELIQNDISNFHSILILGSGSNILFTRNIDGLVIHNDLQGIHTIDEDENNIWLQIMSGTIWHEVVRYAVAHNYGGIENLALIPGTVGAAPIQNIGAYGCEIKEVLTAIHAIDMNTAEDTTFSNHQCRFGYRDSIFKREAKNKYFITSIVLKLDKNPKIHSKYGDIQKVLAERKVQNPSIADVAEAVIYIRNSKLPNPKELGNAGSFFKNPVISSLWFKKLNDKYPDMPHYPTSDEKVKIPAAWLIEQCGWKGKIVGNTGNHIRQPLVIVNYGGATGKEILHHAYDVQKSVADTFGIELEMEVNIL